MYENCKVRPLTYEDLPEILSWRNKPEVRQFMFTQHQICIEEHRKWFDRVSQDTTKRLLIVEDAQVPIGFVQLSNVSYGGVADWGFYARPDSPKGSGRRLGWSALTYAFRELALHKVCGQAIQINHPSIALHNKLGFLQEGILRDQQRIGDAYHTLICFGMLAQEWNPEKLTQENMNVEN